MRAIERSPGMATTDGIDGSAGAVAISQVLSGAVVGRSSGRGALRLSCPIGSQSDEFINIAAISWC